MGDGKHGLIETGPDKFHALVLEKKDITLDEASQEMKTSKETLEAWADFLEEEGMIKIRIGIKGKSFVCPNHFDTISMTKFLKIDRNFSYKNIHDREKLLKKKEDKINLETKKLIRYIEENKALKQKNESLIIKIKEDQAALDLKERSFLKEKKEFGKKLSEFDKLKIALESKEQKTLEREKILNEKISTIIQERKEMLLEQKLNRKEKLEIQKQIELMNRREEMLAGIGKKIDDKLGKITIKERELKDSMLKKNISSLMNKNWFERKKNRDNRLKNLNDLPKMNV